MDKAEFRYLRKALKKTQKQMAALLACSTKAIHSYEQGWRNIPPSVERQILFLISRISPGKPRACWSVKKCTSAQKENCPTWELQAGEFCWLINGTMCEGEPKRNWREKIDLCRSCEVFNANFDFLEKM